MSGTRQNLTYGQQLQVIEFYQQNKYKISMDELLLQLRRKGFATLCAQSVRRYARNEASIRQRVTSNTRNADFCRHSSVAHPDVEHLLWDWITDTESRNLRLTGVLICEKACRIAADLGMSPSNTIAFSDGWLSRFKQRWGLRKYVFHGEAASAPVEQIESQRQILRTVLARHAPANRLNVDETALNFRLCPASGLATHALPGLKVDKTCVTAVLCTSATGEKFTPLIIGHAKRPRCFKHGDPSTYGFYYRHNSKAWMTSIIWKEYLGKLNANMVRENRRVLLLCDNASSHSHDAAAYSNLEVVYLPPNMTSWIQPMDAGIIRTFKSNYRRLLSQNALDLDAQGIADPYKINQLDGMRLAQRAWDGVSASTIQNCWRHTGICPEESLGEAST